MFIACKKYEDSAITYVSKCKTSSSDLRSTLKSLYTAQTKLNTVSSKSTSISKQTASKKRTAYTSASNLIAAILALVSRIQSLDTDEIGTDSTFKAYAINISQTNVLSFTYTSSQISSASTAVTSITTVLTEISTRISNVQSMLSDSTGTTVASSDLGLTTVKTVSDIAVTSTSKATDSSSSDTTTSSKGKFLLLSLEHSIKIKKSFSIKYKSPD